MFVVPIALTPFDIRSMSIKSLTIVSKRTVKIHRRLRTLTKGQQRYHYRIPLYPYPPRIFLTKANRMGWSSMGEFILQYTETIRTSQWLIWVFRDNKILQNCKILQITKMIFFFYLSWNTQKKVAAHIPHDTYPNQNMVSILEFCYQYPTKWETVSVKFYRSEKISCHEKLN